MNLTSLWELVREIPPGKCTTYGILARLLPQPTTGRMVGRWMAQCPDDVPWWRVVNKQGDLPVAKRSPHLAIDQRKRLEQEGVPFKGSHVDLRICFWG